MASFPTVHVSFWALRKISLYIPFVTVLSCSSLFIQILLAATHYPVPKSIPHFQGFLTAATPFLVQIFCLRCFPASITNTWNWLIYNEQKSIWLLVLGPGKSVGIVLVSDAGKKECSHTEGRSKFSCSSRHSVILLHSHYIQPSLLLEPSSNSLWSKLHCLCSLAGPLSLYFPTSERKQACYGISLRPP